MKSTKHLSDSSSSSQEKRGRRRARKRERIDERREEIHIIFFTDPRIGNYECLFEFKMVLHVSVEP